MQVASQCRHDAGLVHSRDKNEQTRNKGQYTPRNVFEYGQRRLPRDDQHDGGQRCAGEKAGNPSGRPNADADSSTTPVSAIPTAASLPPSVSGGAPLTAVTFASSARCCV